MPAFKFRPFVLPFLTLLCFSLASCRPPPLMYYPLFWDYTRAKPKEADLAGKYEVLKIRLSTDLAKSLQEGKPSVILFFFKTALPHQFPPFSPPRARAD